MRLLADANMPRAAFEALSSAGHDVAWIRLCSPGATDREVLAQAMREKRVLLAFDKDFGISRASFGTGCGVILFRIPLSKPSDVGRKLVDLNASRHDWIGHFSVVEPGRIRMRPFLG